MMKICFNKEEENNFLCSSEVEGCSVAGGEAAIPLWMGAFLLFRVMELPW